MSRALEQNRQKATPFLHGGSNIEHRLDRAGDNFRSLFDQVGLEDAVSQERFDLHNPMRDSGHRPYSDTHSAATTVAELDIDSQVDHRLLDVGRGAFEEGALPFGGCFGDPNFNEHSIFSGSLPVVEKELIDGNQDFALMGLQYHLRS
jgi:hypothetical protein